MEGEKDVERLKKILKSKKDARERAKAVDALGNLGEAAMEPLIQALMDDHWEVRRRAAWALGNIGELAVEPLICALKDERWDIRRKATWALGNIRDSRAIEPLLRALTDERADVREQAAWALGNIRDSRAIAPLIHALTDENAGVRREAARSLAVLTVLNEALVRMKIQDHESNLKELEREAFQQCMLLYERELDKLHAKR